jgi:Uri superfamily endonuclease
VNSSGLGTYILALWLDAPQNIQIGRLGRIEFPAGWYLYVGSAMGPGGLQARLARHRRRLADGKRLHWHIDYLREAASWGGAWVSASAQKLECDWAESLCHLPNVEIVAFGFGASDCRCPAHLIHVSGLPGTDWFESTLGAERITVDRPRQEELLQALATGDDKSREKAALALGQFGRDAVKPLATLLTEGNEDDRWWAARALAEVGTNDAVPPLLDALRDTGPDVRACAALALGRIGAGQAAPALAARLGDESAFVASIVADALTMIGEPAVDALTEMLAAESPHARLLAVRALGRIKSEQAIGPLFGALEDSSYLVRYYAQEALDALGVGMVYVAP